MKKIILSFLILSFLAIGSVFAEAKPFDAINTEEFKKEINNSIVIDIRTPQEISLGKITTDALELDFYDKNFKKNLDKLDKDKKYLIYCRSGNRSREAKKIMKELGFKEVHDLEGGIVKWDENLVGGPNRNDVISKYFGKKTLVVLAGTFCPYCQKDIPEIEDRVFNKTGDQLNIIINVIDGENGKRFKTDINQIYDPKLSFDILTGEPCPYVPSWVILDEDGGVIEKSCGNDKGVDGIVNTLKKEKINFNDTKNINKKNDYLSILFLILSLFGLVGGAYWAFKK